MSYKNPQDQRSYNRQWIKKRRVEWLQKHGPCARCGSTNHLEVDHIDPSQKITHCVWSWSEPRRLTELAKCQVLCHDCHAQKTYAPRHGTVTRYNKGCRCEPCRAAKSRHAKKYRNPSRESQLSLIE